MASSKKYVEYDSRQERSKSINRLNDMCMLYHAKRNHQELFNHTGTLFLTLKKFLEDNDNLSKIQEARKEYYEKLQEHKKVVASGMHKTSRSYHQNVYIPLTIELMKLADKVFETLSDAINEEGIFTPYSVSSGEGFDIESVFSGGNM